MNLPQKSTICKLLNDRLLIQFAVPEKVAGGFQLKPGDFANNEK